jgi:crotonobetainyl-CoA:carnitine CoA-transferase CaiB-like acyl-CoA transferase
VLNIEEAYDDPQLRHRGMVVEMDTPSGRQRYIGSPIKLSDAPFPLRTPPAALGEHTEAVLRDLGYTPGDIASLRDQGVIA